MKFVNRVGELTELEKWWSKPGARLGLVWGRRRVGKTLLLQRFAHGRPRTMFHTFAGRSASDELAVLLASRRREHPTEAERAWVVPPDTWTRFLADLSREAREGPVLLILDEFQEGLRTVPELPGVIRALWDNRRARGQLRILLCGSAMRTMEATQEERAPLYGRFDLRLLVHPFGPQESALMLPELHPHDRAIAWGLVGGMPPYLDAWDQGADLENNLYQLFFAPAGRLLLEGDLALHGEMLADLEVSVLHAIALGHTQYQEIRNSLHAEPTRQLERLIELRLIERVQPVTEIGSRSRRRIYRIADNFLAFWLGHVAPHRASIDRGLGHAIADVMRPSLRDFLGPRWEDAVRIYLTGRAAAGDFGPVVAVGPFWAHERPAEAQPIDTEIDIVMLSGQSREAILVGEAKLRRIVDARPIVAALERKAERLPRQAASLQLVVAAPLEVTNVAPGLITVTANEIFGIRGEKRKERPRYVIE